MLLAGDELAAAVYAAADDATLAMLVVGAELSTVAAAYRSSRGRFWPEPASSAVERFKEEAMFFEVMALWARNANAAILLNTPLVNGWEAIWAGAPVRACADGGANRLFDYACQSSTPPLPPPTFVKGDLDSIRPEVRKHYERAEGGVSVLHDVSQNSTDLGKCMEELLARGAVSPGSTVVVLGALSGRFDHILAAVHFAHAVGPATYRVILVSDESWAVVLPAGEHTIEIDATREGPTCGLVPVAGPARVRTTGLRWNLRGKEDCPTTDTQSILFFFFFFFFFAETSQWGFGAGLAISTSNHVESDRVTVQTDAPVLWTIVRKQQ